MQPPEQNGEAPSPAEMLSKYPQPIVDLVVALWTATLKEEAAAVQAALPAKPLKQLLENACTVLKAEKTLLELTSTDPAIEYLMVGDTHGHFHDTVQMLSLYGPPSEQRVFVFNGDYVDRGAWGYELTVLLLSLKLHYPQSVHLLRGNHESTTCTTWYGFKAELVTKWGKESKAVYALFRRIFSMLPLGALIQGKTLVMHGGLFRAVETQGSSKGAASTGSSLGGAAKRKRKRAPAAPPGEPVLGTLDMLRAAPKGGQDPDGEGTSVVAADVLWSDPIAEPGLRLNDARGVGLVFGPDTTQAFLEANGLSLILRSHEGPDARDRRTDMSPVTQGWSLDHDTPAGRLYTVFSAPDYPMFMSETEDRYRNLGAVAVLTGPTWTQPEMRSFSAVEPRPKAKAFYDYEAHPDTDEEPQGSDAGSAMSDDLAIAACGASDADTAAHNGATADDDTATTSNGHEHGHHPAKKANTTTPPDSNGAQTEPADESAGDGVKDTVMTEPDAPPSAPAATSSRSPSPAAAAHANGVADGVPSAAQASSPAPESATVAADANGDTTNKGEGSGEGAGQGDEEAPEVKPVGDSKGVGVGGTPAAVASGPAPTGDDSEMVTEEPAPVSAVREVSVAAAT